jgi:hypothetical protein
MVKDDSGSYRFVIPENLTQVTQQPLPESAATSIADLMVMAKLGRLHFTIGTCNFATSPPSADSAMLPAHTTLFIEHHTLPVQMNIQIQSILMKHKSD